MVRVLVGLSLFVLVAAPAPAGPLLGALRGTHWGESSRQLVRQFGTRATALPWRLDFGDAYTDVVLREESLGGVRVIVFFEMDKKTGGLRRIQIEQPRHDVNPPAARAILKAVEAAYGAPDRRSLSPPRAANGYQATDRWSWLRDGAIIRAIFRDTTIEAVEGCIDRPLPCGLTGRLLVRISPAVDRGLTGSR